MTHNLAGETEVVLLRGDWVIVERLHFFTSSATGATQTSSYFELLRVYRTYFKGKANMLVSPYQFTYLAGGKSNVGLNQFDMRKTVGKIHLVHYAVLQDACQQLIIDRDSINPPKWRTLEAARQAIENARRHVRAKARE